MLSYSHALILAELPVLNPLSTDDYSDLSAKACLILEDQECFRMLTVRTCGFIEMYFHYFQTEH